MNKTFITLVCIMAMGYGLTGCKKFLDVKPDVKLVLPTTVEDVQAMMDNIDRMNNSSPSAAEMSADNYYIDYTDWNALTDMHAKGLYAWQWFDNTSQSGWNYAAINNCNTGLETLDKITPDVNNIQQYNNVKGQVLFFRAYHYMQMAFIYTQAYGTNAANDMGLPLKLTSGIDEPTVRSTNEQTYALITQDLLTASELLPATQAYKSRPSKTAAFAALARVYLAMEKYGDAKRFADSVLALHNTLIDYNTLSTTAANPIARFNNEVIFHSRTDGGSTLSTARAKIDSNLYNSYHANDLRKVIFYRSNGNGTYAFKGNYDGTSSVALFTGLATDELYFILAECEARLGNTNAALTALNTVMQKRWKTGLFVPFTATSADAALALILAERRKELVFRHLRWTDLKRLNKDSRFAVTLKRNLNGVIHELPPNDLRYVILIPTVVIQRSGIPQNPR